MSRNGHFSRSRTRRPREKLYITPRELPEEPNPVKLVEPIYVDHQAAAVWLSLFTPGDGTRIDWMPEVVETYSSWTAEANGAALDNCAEVDNPPRQWNPIYWRLVARCVALWDDATLNRFCLHPLTSQLDESFLDAMSRFLRSLDFLYLTGKGPTTERAVAIRAALVQHFRTTRQFKQLASRHDHFIEHHISEALQAIFFNSTAFRGRPECYVPQEDVRKLFPFIPILEALAIDGASLGAAIVATALLDAVVIPEFSSFGIALAEAWMAHFPDDTVFWIDNGIGKRWCKWLEGLYAVSPTTFAPDTPLRRATDKSYQIWFASGWPKPVSLKSRFAHELVHTVARWFDLNRSSKGGRSTAVARAEPPDVGTENGRFRR